jgi:hypothetical protein
MLLYYQFLLYCTAEEGKDGGDDTWASATMIRSKIPDDVLVHTRVRITGDRVKPLARQGIPSFLQRRDVGMRFGWKRYDSVCRSGRVKAVGQCDDEDWLQAQDGPGEAHGRILDGRLRGGEQCR